MAKKDSRKDRKKGTSAGKKVDGKKGKKTKKPRAPKPVKTGKGAKPHEVAGEFMTLFNAGDYATIEDRLWSPDVVSVEGMGVAMAWHGRASVRAKNEEWMALHKIHGVTAEGPFVGASGFSVKFAMDVEDTTNGERSTMEEVAVYTIERGKIVREEFMYRG